MKKLSFVIPCYNSEKTIENVVNDIKKVVEKRDAYDYEIILVNDFSKDRTSSVLEMLAMNDEKIVVINFAKRPARSVNGWI